MHDGFLSDADHDAMDGFLIRLLDGYKNGDVTREQAASGLAHVMAALDQGNTAEALSWFNQPGIGFFKDGL